LLCSVMYADWENSRNSSGATKDCFSVSRNHDQRRVVILRIDLYLKESLRHDWD
jgi:hypothetical protein